MGAERTVLRGVAIGFALVVALAAAPAALATTETAQSGNVSASLMFQGSANAGYNNVTLQIRRGGALLYDQPVASRFCPTRCGPAAATNSVHALDLESDGEPDVVLDLYSGGAHCCVIEQIFSFDSAANTYTKTERNFGDPGATIEDLGHDGHFELVSADDSFAYAFTNYARSGLPLQIWTFHGRRFTDVTRGYPAQITQDAAKWFRFFQQNLDDGLGFIAAWAADEDLIGHEAQVSSTLAAEARRGDLRSPSPEVQPGGAKFIAALQKFLREHGYVTAQACSTAPIPADKKDKNLEIEGCFVPGDHGTFVSTGEVKVNGLDFLPQRGGKITVDPKAPSLRATGDGIVKLGGVVPVWAWSNSSGLDVPLSGTTTLINNRNAKVFGFPVSGSLQASFGDGTLTVSGTVSLRVVGDDVTASLSATADNTGIVGATVSAKGAGEDPRFHELSSCSLKKPPPLGFACASVTNEKGNTYSGLVPTEPSIIHIGPLAVKDVSLTYDGHKHEWAGEGELAIGDLLPGPQVLGKLLPTLGLGVKIGTQPFRFDGASASDSDLNLTLGPAVLKEISFGLELHPAFKVSGDADLAASTGSLEIKGGFDYEGGETSGFQLKLHGTVSLESVTIDGFVTYDGRDGAKKVTLGGSFSRSFGPASATLALSGGLGSGHFELDGDGEVSAFGQSAGGHGVLSDAGVGACAHVSVLFFSGDIGFKHFWNGETDFNGCDFGGLRTVGAGQAVEAAAGHSVTLPAGRAGEEFAAVGANGPPAVTLTGPKGEQLSTPTVPDRTTITQSGLALAVSSSNTTYFIVTRPAAGSWTLTPEPGAAAPVRYEIANPLAPLGLVAHVYDRGHARVLSWRFDPQPGVSVHFIQRGGTEQTIASTSRGSGRIPFAVAAGPGGRRKIVAVVSVDGVPRQTLTVATFRLPKPRSPRIASARYRLRLGVLGVSWARVRHASYYEIEIGLAGGRSYRYRVTGRAGNAKFAVGRRAHVKRVRIIVAVDGLAGTAVDARRTR
jgi:hypothetical protein